jgi:hypothetical protein
VYNRAGLWRTAALVVLPSVTAVSTGAVAREQRTAPIDGAENVRPSLVTTHPDGYLGHDALTGQPGSGKRR